MIILEQIFYNGIGSLTFSTPISFLYGPKPWGKTTILNDINLLCDRIPSISKVVHHQSIYGTSYYKFNPQFFNVQSNSLGLEQNGELVLNTDASLEHHDTALENVKDLFSVEFLNNKEMKAVSHLYHTGNYTKAQAKLYSLIDYLKDMENTLIIIDELGEFYESDYVENLFQFFDELAEKNQIIVAVKYPGFKEFTRCAFVEIHPQFAQRYYEENGLYDDIKNYTVEEETFYSVFKGSLITLKMLLRNITFEDDDLLGKLHNLFYANVITTMESYLSDTFINIIIKNDDVLQRFLDKNPKEFSKVKNDADWNDMKEKKLRVHFSRISFHNMRTTREFYENDLEITLPITEEIKQAVIYRHRIFHNNGKLNSGRYITIGVQDIIDLIKGVKKFISPIQTQIETKYELRKQFAH